MDDTDFDDILNFFLEWTAKNVAQGPAATVGDIKRLFMGLVSEVKYRYRPID